MADIPGNELQVIAEKEMGANFIEFPVQNRELPQHIDLNKFGENSGIARIVLASLNSFIHAPIVVDKYEDHDERRKQRDALTEKVRANFGDRSGDDFDKLLTNNKLKRNSVSGMYTALIYYQETIAKSPTATRIINIINKEIKQSTDYDSKTGETAISDPWKHKTLDEKKEVVRKINDLSIDMLWEIANK